MTDIVTVVGARPQFIKCAPVSRVLRERFSEYLVHTGQHYDQNMSDIFFDELGIPQPDLNLRIGSGSHGHQTGQMLSGIEEVLMAQKPRIVLVYGDTNSTIAGALAAVKLHIPVAHIEAGLRSYDRSMPEEINRVMTDHISTLLFCPTVQAVENLRKEGIVHNVMMTGDVMVDILLQARDASCAAADDLLRMLKVDSGGFFLSTIHRPVNTDDPKRLNHILQGLESLFLPVILPLHPRTRVLMERAGIDDGRFGNIRFISPLSYHAMVQMMSRARVVITDSGGVQKEAYLLKVPCVTLRDTTEWGETVDDGWNVLVDADMEALSAAVERFMSFTPPEHHTRYGDGNASAGIVRAIASFLEGGG